MQRSRIRRFDRGEGIFLHQSPSRSCYVVMNGWVKLYRILASGDEAVLRMHTRGEAFAFADALRQGQHHYGADAASECLLLEIPSDALRHILANDPGFATVLLGHSFEQIDALSDQIEALKCRSGVQRVAAFLRQHARPRGNHMFVTLPYEKVLMAAYLGIKPESLSRALAKLRDVGVVAAEGGLEITDPDALDELIDLRGAERRMAAS
ncbi:MAG: Crp/Fnr family transcriptional regulator [Paracoccaceae bacterium]